MRSNAGVPESNHGAVSEATLRGDAETLNRLACDLTADLDLQELVQRVCDAGTSLTHARFGAFFSSTHNETGDCSLLYALSGAPRDAFETFGTPSTSELFGPTNDGAAPVRIADVLEDPRYGKHGPHLEMREGRMPVRSYLAVPVISRSGEVLGGLIFGHPDVGVFDERAERMALGVAAQAAVAIDNARLLAQAHEESLARRDSEAALRVSEARYRELVGLLPVAVYTCDAEGRITFFNESAATFWGREPRVGDTDEHFCGSFKLWQADGTPLPHEQTPMAVALRTGKAFRNRDVTIERPDGSRVHVLVNIDPIRNAAGRIIGAINVFQDITKRKHAEVSLRRQFDQLQAIYRLSNAAGRAETAQEISESALDSLLAGVRANRAAVLLFDDDGVSRFTSWCGVSQDYRDAVEGHAPWSATDVDAQPVPVSDVEQDESLAVYLPALQREGIRALAFIPVKSASRVLGKFMVYYEQPHEFGEEELQLCQTLAGHVAFAVERWQAEGALRASEERYRAVVEGQSEMVCRFRLDGTILFVNGAYARMRGTTPEALWGASFWEFIEELDRPRVKAMLDRLTPDEPEIYIENRLDTVDGVRWTLWTNRALRFDENGQPTELQSAGIDITDRKNTEAALKSKEAELEVVAETTPLILTRCSRDLRYRFVNRAAATWFGLEPDEIVGRPIVEILGESAFATIRPYIDEVLQGTPVEFETQINYPHVGHRWVRVNYVPEHGEFGNVTGWVASIVDITARREAEQSLRESEDRFRMLADNIPQLAWVWDSNGEAVWYNKRWYDYTGTTFEQMKGWGWTAVHHPDHVDRVVREVKRAWESGKPWRDTFPLRGKDGNYQWFYSQAQPIRDEKGNLLRWFGTNTDITEQLEAETAVRQSEEQFRRAIEEAPVPVIMHAEDGEVLQISRTWSDLTGYTMEDAPLFQEWLADAYGRGGAKVQHAVTKIFEQGQGIQNLEFEVETRQGRKREWHLNASSPGTLRDGRRFVVCMAQDITERKRIEAALRESESRFRDMADYAPVLIFVNGPDGCEFVNREYLHFLGRPFNDVRGMRWLEFVHPDDREPLIETYQRALEERRPFEIKHRFLRSDGEYRWLQSSGVPRFTRTGEMLGYVGCAVDFTDQHRAQDSLEKQSSLLEDAIRERTAELEQSNQRLRLAERMASLGTLSAGLGHDIGNLLLPVRVRLESLAGATLPHEMREHVEVIRQSTEYLQRLASGLRMLAIDPDRSPPNESTLISEWWMDAEPMFSNALPRSVKLSSSLPDHECWVAVSRAALTQMVFNLVQNAGEATREVRDGEVSVIIKAEKSQVRIAVSDNGHGMPEEVKRHCMEPFYTTKARGFSTGLGLSLIHRLVHDSHGEMHVESEPGRGTAFTITLARARVDDGNVTADGQPRLAVVHLSDARLQAYACAELRTHKFDVTTGPSRIHEGELVVLDGDPADLSLRQDATVILLNGHACDAEDQKGKSAAEMPSGRVVRTAPRPKAIRTAIAELVQKGTRARSSEQKVTERRQQH